jgi:hypothetical protein
MKGNLDSSHSLQDIAHVHSQCFFASYKITRFSACMGSLANSSVAGSYGGGSLASCKRRRNVNPVSGGVTGRPCSSGI